MRPIRTLSRCASIGLVLLRELTFWSTRNVGATISDAASPVDEIEKLKARHAADIERTWITGRAVMPAFAGLLLSMAIMVWPRRRW